MTTKRESALVLRITTRAIRVKQLEHQAKIAHYNRLLPYFWAGIWGNR